MRPPPAAPAAAAAPRAAVAAAPAAGVAAPRAAVAAPPAGVVAAPPAAGVAAPPAGVVAAPDTPEERRARLTVLAEEVRTCSRCALHATRRQTVFARGNPLSELVFVGEGPGAEEDQRGEPFVGAAGQLLDRMIVAMGYLRDDVYICNIVKCRPPENRKPEPAEMASCAPFLTAQLAVLKPRVIVALGATAVQGLIGTTEGITRLRGTWKLYKGAVPIMPTFHPAYLLRQERAKRDVWNDLKEVLRFLGRSVPERG